MTKLTAIAPATTRRCTSFRCGNTVAKNRSNDDASTHQTTPRTIPWPGHADLGRLVSRCQPSACCSLRARQRVAQVDIAAVAVLPEQALEFAASSSRSLVIRSGSVVVAGFLSCNCSRDQPIRCTRCFASERAGWNR